MDLVALVSKLDKRNKKLMMLYNMTFFVVDDSLILKYNIFSHVLINHRRHVVRRNKMSARTEPFTSYVQFNQALGEAIALFMRYV